MQFTYVILNLVATFKIKKEETGEINFKKCYFTQHIHNIIVSTCNQHNINKTFYVLFVI